MNATLVSNTRDGGAVLDKRFPIYATVAADCPKCGTRASDDTLTADYPVVGKPFPVWLICPQCGEEIEVRLRIDVVYQVLS